MADIKKIKAQAKGLMTFLPGIGYFLDAKKQKSLHSCSDPLFCYNLWLRILVYLKGNKININSARIGEIGNGGSFGLGICALLSGSAEYTSLEIERIFDVDLNLILLDDIVQLFKQKTPISSQLNTSIDIKCFDYPEDLIKPLFLNERYIEGLRAEISEGLINQNRLRILKNWQDYPSQNLDFIFSRAVMEHVRNPSNVYKSAINHLHVNALMLHDIELHSHGITNEPDGHYEIPERVWKIIYGKRKYFLNRWSLEEHLEELELMNCNILDVNKKYGTSLKHRDVLTGATVLSKVSGKK